MSMHGEIQSIKFINCTLVYNSLCNTCSITIKTISPVTANIRAHGI